MSFKDPQLLIKNIRIPGQKFVNHIQVFLNNYQKFEGKKKLHLHNDILGNCEHIHQGLKHLCASNKQKKLISLMALADVAI
jgi:hypothetical protein